MSDIFPSSQRGVGENIGLFSPHIRRVWGENSVHFPPIMGGNRKLTLGGWKIMGGKRRRRILAESGYFLREIHREKRRRRFVRNLGIFLRETHREKRRRRFLRNVGHLP